MTLNLKKERDNREVLTFPKKLSLNLDISRCCFVEHGKAISTMSHTYMREPVGKRVYLSLSIQYPLNAVNSLSHLVTCIVICFQGLCL